MCTLLTNREVDAVYHIHKRRVKMYSVNMHMHTEILYQIHTLLLWLCWRNCLRSQIRFVESPDKIEPMLADDRNHIYYYILFNEVTISFRDYPPSPSPPPSPPPPPSSPPPSPAPLPAAVGPPKERPRALSVWYAGIFIGLGLDMVECAHGVVCAPSTCDGKQMRARRCDFIFFCIFVRNLCQHWNDICSKNYTPLR